MLLSIVVFLSHVPNSLASAGRNGRVYGKAGIRNPEPEPETETEPEPEPEPEPKK